MTKNINTFPSLLEHLLVNIWGGTKERLVRGQLIQTRKALSTIRAIYRFKGEHGTRQPSKINYKFKKNRAGYLAAFGERHAYLPLLHLRKVQAKKPDIIPQPRGRRNELVITSLGAGACIELYGICLFYLGTYQQPLHLTLNSIDKEREWVSNRHIVFTRVLKETFPKIDVDSVDIDADIREEAAVSKFATYYDRLKNTDILLIYNVMNEISTMYAKRVWRNIKFLLDIFQRPVLILVMEPSAERAEPRIIWLKERLAHETELTESSKEELFSFNVAPVCIEMSKSEDDLNYRLFGIRIDGSKSNFETSIERSHMACVKKPNSPITMEQVTLQLSILEMKRGRKGAFLPRHDRLRQQYTFGHINDQWK